MLSILLATCLAILSVDPIFAAKAPAKAPAKDPAKVGPVVAPVPPPSNEVIINKYLKDPEAIENTKIKTPEAAQKLAELGFIPSPKDGNFGLNQPITRREYMRLIYNMFGKSWYGLREATDEYTNYYSMDNLNDKKLYKTRILDVKKNDPDFVAIMYTIFHTQIPIGGKVRFWNTSTSKGDELTANPPDIFEGDEVKCYPDSYLRVCELSSALSLVELREFVDIGAYPDISPGAWYEYRFSVEKLDKTQFTYKDPFFPKLSPLLASQLLTTYYTNETDHILAMLESLGLWNKIHNKGEHIFTTKEWLDFHNSVVSRGEVYLTVYTVYSESLRLTGRSHNIDHDKEAYLFYHSLDFRANYMKSL